MLRNLRPAGNGTLAVSDRPGLDARGFPPCDAVADEEVCRAACCGFYDSPCDRRGDEPRVDLARLWSRQFVEPDRMDKPVSRSRVGLLGVEHLPLRHAPLWRVVSLAGRGTLAQTAFCRHGAMSYCHRILHGGAAEADARRVGGFSA